MTRALAIILLLLSGLLGQPHHAEPAHCLVLETTQDSGQATCSQQHAPDRQATLGESPSLPNLVSTRTLRILPTQSAKQNRLLKNGLPVAVKRHKTFLNAFSGSGQPMAAPFQRCVSCHYFIFALRRILC